MYLHVGNQCDIRSSDIIGIFDADTATVSAMTKKFLSSANRGGGVEFAAEEIPKSFVLFWNRRKKKYQICFSQLSSAALAGRIRQYGEF